MIPHISSCRQAGPLAPRGQVSIAQGQTHVFFSCLLLFLRAIFFSPFLNDGRQRSKYPKQRQLSGLTGRRDRYKHHRHCGHRRHNKAFTNRRSDLLSSILHSIPTGEHVLRHSHVQSMEYGVRSTVVQCHRAGTQGRDSQGPFVTLLFVAISCLSLSFCSDFEHRHTLQPTTGLFKDIWLGKGLGQSPSFDFFDSLTMLTVKDKNCFHSPCFLSICLLTAVETFRPPCCVQHLKRPITSSGFPP